MSPKLITSRDNPEFKDLRSLLESKGVQQLGCSLISGKKMVEECLSLHPKIVDTLIYSSEHNVDGRHNIRSIVLAAEMFRDLDVFHTDSPLLKVAVPDLPLVALDPPVGVEVLIPFQHPDNVGAALRSCSAFQVQRVYLSREAAHPFHVKSLRASGPSVFDLEIRRVAPYQTLNLPASSFVFDAGGEALHNMNLSGPCLIVMGLEGLGVGRHAESAQRIGIPMRSRVESLNAAQCLSIALYHSYVQRLGVHS